MTQPLGRHAARRDGADVVRYVLWRVCRKAQGPDAARGTVRQEEFQHWVSGEFDIWQDRVTGANAAVQILLPLAAVAFGMTAFGFVLHFTAPGV
jgi:hypothetical protein